MPSVVYVDGDVGYPGNLQSKCHHGIRFDFDSAPQCIADNSDGLITIDYSDGGTMGSHAEILDGTNMGVYDICLSGTTYFETWVPEAIILTMPFLVDDYDHAQKIFSGEAADWFNELVMEATNCRIIGYGWTGFRYVLSEAEIDSLAECEGVLIRSPEINMYTDLLGLLGFSYVTMAWSEAYTAMSTGIIEAVECPLMNLYEQGFYDLGTNLLGTRHLLADCAYVMNNDKYNSLPAVYQQIIDDAMAIAIEGERQACMDSEQYYKDLMAAEGCTFHEFDQASYDELQEIFGAYWDEKAAEFDSEAQAMLQEIIALKG